jgi:hypothetical protein
MVGGRVYRASLGKPAVWLQECYCVVEMAVEYLAMVFC